MNEVVSIFTSGILVDDSKKVSNLWTLAFNTKRVSNLSGLVVDPTFAPSMSFN